ncbi:MAG: hypothetical protein IH863_06975, partial [Chloroflexi bacterium]|nr:hypothetical protein [Chloroflexota bacterium]
MLGGQAIRYTVEFENEGEGIAFGVFVTDILPPEVDDSTLVLEEEEGALYDPETRTIIWTIGEVGPGEGGERHFSVDLGKDVECGVEVINWATVYFPSVPETTPTNGVTTIVIHPECDLDGDFQIDTEDVCPAT